MKRIQFYPDEELANILFDEARNHGVSVSTYVTEVLLEYYGLTNNALISQLTAAVLKEVEDYISNHVPGDVFDLNTASEKFRNITMTCGKRPQTVRASIGKSFASKIGEEPFENIEKYVDEQNKEILSVNNARMYIINGKNKA